MEVSLKPYHICDLRLCFQQSVAEAPDDCPKLMRSLREAVLRGDHQGMEQAAHSLKGAASNFGARAVVERALQLEVLGRTNNLFQAENMVRELDTSLNDLISELTHFLISRHPNISTQSEALAISQGKLDQ